ncbi:MAG: hypothetical protein IJF02_00015 [Oscillospiraceae bacterium]|nr:hypothetical protein [Oscillospiraceae bacterium]
MATLNPIFASHMVFQANQPIRIFGSGCGKVTVSLAGQTSTVCSTGPDWLIELDSRDYGGPYSMEVVIDSGQTVLKDIYFGDVYLLGGQSNMQLKLRKTNESPECYVMNDDVRLFSVDRPEEGECIFSRHGWVLCTKELAGEFPAIGYYVGIRMAEATGRKIGLISCCQGASVIQTWMPKELFDNDHFYVSDTDKFQDHFDFPWNGYGHLYETMLSKVIPFSINAVLWYQGEANTSIAEAAIYLDLLDAFIANTRRVFQNSTLPFIVVQLPVYIPWDGPGWRGIQAAQMRAQDKIPGVRTVISWDICQNDDLHPKDKKQLGLRIAENLLKL